MTSLPLPPDNEEGVKGERSRSGSATGPILFRRFPLLLVIVLFYMSLLICRFYVVAINIHDDNEMWTTTTMRASWTWRRELKKHCLRTSTRRDEKSDATQNAEAVANS